MPKFEERRQLPYTPAQMYDLIADVAKYPEFLPWCQGARLYKQEEGSFHADLIIGFKMFRERFTSHVLLGENEIEINYIKGPLKYLKNHWRFSATDEGCDVDFMVDFEFRSKIFEKLVGHLFTEAVHRMVLAFEKRAADLYDIN